MSDVKVYGTDWCHDTTNTREFLDRAGVDYDYIDIEADAAGMRWLKDHNHGKQKMPTLDIKGQVLSIPDNEALESALRGKGLLS